MRSGGRRRRGRRRRGTVAVVLLAAVLLLAAVVPTGALANGSGLPSVIPDADRDNYRSELRGLNPPVPGLTLEVLERDDRLRLRNETGQTVVVEGDVGEPMFRFLPSGRVEANRRSRSAWLGRERFGRVRVPSTAGRGIGPRWNRASDGGELSWHEHRIHWMLAERPRQVTDPERKTKIFEWAVPLSVGGRAATAEGTLFWVPDRGVSAGGGASSGLIVLLVLLTIAGVSAAVFAVSRSGGGTSLRRWP